MPNFSPEGLYQIAFTLAIYESAFFLTVLSVYCILHIFASLVEKWYPSFVLVACVNFYVFSYVWGSFLYPFFVCAWSVHVSVRFLAYYTLIFKNSVCIRGISPLFVAYVADISPQPFQLSFGFAYGIFCHIIFFKC